MSPEKSHIDWWRNRQARLNPAAPGGVMSTEVNRLRLGGNPHPHSLAEAVEIAQGRIKPTEAQSPLPADSSKEQVLWPNPQLEKK